MDRTFFLSIEGVRETLACAGHARRLRNAYAGPMPAQETQTHQHIAQHHDRGYIVHCYGFFSQCTVRRRYNKHPHIVSILMLACSYIMVIDLQN